MRKYFLLFILFLSGCSIGLTKPEVELANINLSDITLFKTGMDVSVQIDNENQEPLAIKNSVHRLYLNDIYLGKGFSNEEVVIQPFSRAVVDVDLQLSNLAIGQLIAESLGKDSLKYKLESSLYLNGSSFFNKYTVERSGTIRTDEPLTIGENPAGKLRGGSR